MHIQSNTPEPKPHGAVPAEDEEIEVDVDNDPGNEDPGSQFDRDATVPLIDPEHP
jgi:hypothetical protein